MRCLTFLAFLVIGLTASLQAGPKADLVVVKKSQRKMWLECDGEVLRQYRVALGGNPVGHKERQGDKRTPEGTYTLSKRSSSNFYKAIHISYPNSRDVSQARSRGDNPGGNILIHGSPDNLAGAGAMLKLVDWTDGCIAVTNKEMDEIWDLVDSGTRIVIDP